MNTKGIGQRSEAVILAMLLKMGKTVLIPFGDNERYDLVVDEDGSFRRIQCKTARRVKGGGALTFDCCSSAYHRGGKKRGYEGEVDLFGVYFPEEDSVYLVPIEDASSTICTLRLEEPKSRNQYGSRYAEDYRVG